MNCSKCGHKIEDDSRYCNYCGSSIVKENAKGYTCCLTGKPTTEDSFMVVRCVTDNSRTTYVKHRAWYLSDIAYVKNDIINTYLIIDSNEYKKYKRSVRYLLPYIVLIITPIIIDMLIGKNCYDSIKDIKGTQAYDELLSDLYITLAIILIPGLFLGFLLYGYVKKLVRVELDIHNGSVATDADITKYIENNFPEIAPKLKKAEAERDISGWDKIVNNTLVTW